MRLKSKEKRLCSGKLIVTDFKRLNPKNLLLVEDLTSEQLNRELAVCTADGRVYVNIRIAGHELFCGVFENLMSEDIKTLEEFQEIYSEKFSHIKTFSDWGAWTATATEEDDKELTLALAMLLIPTELQRRKIESNYYGK